MPEFVPDEFDHTDVRVTPRFTVLAGHFQLSRAAVPYFQANVSMEELQRYLKLVEDLPAEDRETWSLEELFQRDIDWDRVEADIVKGYLQARTKRTFFNALTVALLPLNDGGRLASAYGSPTSLLNTDGPFGSSDYRTIGVGGIQIARRSQGESPVAYLRWDESAVFAATIDGQHRLAALRTFMERAPLTASQRRTRVPVIFLVMDERLGFHLDDQDNVGSRNPLLSVVREVFIDLNKHAKPVSIARQVLLDDQEIEARCTRSLLLDTVATDLPEPCRALALPLGLVDWQSGAAKFDQGPFVTTVTALYLMVKEMLAIKAPSDPLDETQVKRFIQSIEQTLSVSQQLQRTDGARSREYQSHQDLLVHMKENYLDEELPVSSIPRHYVSAAVDSFERLYRPLVVGVFARFEPYSSFWAESFRLGGTTGQLAHYLAQNERGRRRWKEELLIEQEFQSRIADPLKMLQAKKANEWAFMVVWQKALMRATFDCYIHSQLILNGQELPTPEQFLDRWIPFLNTGYANGLFRLNAPFDLGDPSKGELWEGICKNPISLTIKYSNAASMRARDLLVLYWYLHERYEGSVSGLASAVVNPDSNSSLPGAARCFQQLEGSLKSVMKQRFAEEDDERISMGAKDRLIGILERWS